MKKALVAVDGSECSRRAFEYSLDEAEELGNEITIFRVVPSFGHAGEVLEESLKDEIKEAEKFTKKLKKEAEKRGIEVKAEVVTGANVANKIVKFADVNDYDLIVVGSRGKTELETITLGSVSEGVVKRANCPVLVIR